MQFTCVTAPEVTEGPFYINNEMIRQDLTEGERFGITHVSAVPIVMTDIIAESRLFST